MKKKILIVIAILVLAANLPPCKQVLTILTSDGYYRYSTGKGSFTFEEIKARNYDMMRRRYTSFKYERKSADTVLFRLFNRSPLHFWRWGDYLIDERYNLPYKSWEAIKKERGAVENKSGYQDF
jgi:hypothetical protein